MEHKDIQIENCSSLEGIASQLQDLFGEKVVIIKDHLEKYGGLYKELRSTLFLFSDRYFQFFNTGYRFLICEEVLLKNYQHISKFPTMDVYGEGEDAIIFYEPADFDTYSKTHKNAKKNPYFQG